MENIMMNMGTKINNIEGKISHIDLIDSKLNMLILLLDEFSTIESYAFDYKV